MEAFCSRVGSAGAFESENKAYATSICLCFVSLACACMLRLIDDLLHY